MIETETYDTAGNLLARLDVRPADPVAAAGCRLIVNQYLQSVITSVLTTLLSAEQAAAELGIGRVTLVNAAARRRLGRKVGSYWIYTPAEVAALRADGIGRGGGKVGRPRKVTP